MYWGFITPDGSFGLVNCPLPYNAKAYRDVFDQNLTKDYAKFGWKLMEGNCPVHRAEIMRDYLAESHIQTIEWPPYSADLNIIENVWALMKKRMTGMTQTKENLESIENARKSISSDFVKNCINLSVPE